MKLSFINFSSFSFDGIDPLIVLFKIRENIGCSHKRILCFSSKVLLKNREMYGLLSEKNVGKGFSFKLGTLRNYDGDGKENVKKAIGLMSKTTTLHVHHAFLYISLLSLHNYDVK